MNGTIISTPSKLALVNEQTWIQVGSLSETLCEPDRAIHAYESALRHNPYSTLSLSRLGLLHKKQEHYHQAAECYQRLLIMDGQQGLSTGPLLPAKPKGPSCLVRHRSLV